MLLKCFYQRGGLKLSTPQRAAITVQGVKIEETINLGSFLIITRDPCWLNLVKHRRGNKSLKSSDCAGVVDSSYHCCLFLGLLSETVPAQRGGTKRHRDELSAYNQAIIRLMVYEFPFRAGEDFQQTVPEINSLCWKRWKCTFDFQLRVTLTKRCDQMFCHILNMLCCVLSIPYCDRKPVFPQTDCNVDDIQQCCNSHACFIREHIRLRAGCCLGGCGMMLTSCCDK